MSKSIMNRSSFLIVFARITRALAVGAGDPSESTAVGCAYNCLKDIRILLMLSEAGIVVRGSRRVPSLRFRISRRRAS
jgi:hypothetical protein